VRKLLLLAAFLAPSNAGAYECIDVPNANPRLTQAWNQRCIPYFISNNGSLFDGETRRLLISQSFSVWSTSACTDLAFMDLGYTDQAPGFDERRDDNKNIIISIEDEASARVLFTRRELAITVTSFNTATGEIFDADIMFNAVDWPFAEVENDPQCDAIEPRPYDLRNTLVHEIGHFIGFEHDGDGESTMYDNAQMCETKKRTLTQDNILGICNVYGTAQETRTCFPPDTYDKGPGDPSDFRNQCERALMIDEGGGCGCTTAAASGHSLWLWVGLLFLMRRKRTALSGR
jgi:hypothetical protein